MDISLFWMTLVAAMVACAQANIKQLYQHLLNPSYYNKRVRPAANPSDPVNVTLQLSIHEIIDLNDKKQRLDLKITIREYWIDKSLSWNKTQFNGIESIAVHPDDIWIPDVVLYNNAGVGFGDGITRTEALIRHDGLVCMNIPSLLQSTCKVHLENYPFDRQTCRVKFGSWNYDVARLRLKVESLSADLTHFSPNVEWELLEVPAEFHTIKYDCCTYPFEDIEYFVKIKRRSLFHAMYLIIPCAVISLLTLLVFLLPPDCNERMTVGMAILVGLSFFFLLVAENMPATSDTVPVIGLYYSVTMLEVSSAFFMTCFVLMCHHHNPLNGDLSDWSRKYLQVFARFLGFPFNFKKDREKSDQVVEEKTSRSTNGSVSTFTLRTYSASSRTSKTLEDLNKADTVLQDHIDNEELMEKIKTDWKMAALVLNSVFMWIYIIAVAVTLSVLLLTHMIPAL